MSVMSVVRLCCASLCVAALGACDEAPEPGHYTGYVEAELVYIAAPQSGWLIETAVREGDPVVEGMRIAALDDELQRAQVGEAQSQLAQAEEQLRDAEATLELARTERARARDLVKRGVAPKARIDKAEADYASALARLRTAQENVTAASAEGEDTGGAAQAAVAQARWALNERTIEARRTGRVEEVFHRTGEFVMAGAPLISMLPEEGLKVRFFVPQTELAPFAPGMAVNVFHDGSAEPLEAHVSFIAREAEFTPPVIYSEESRESLVFLVEARFAKPVDLRPGLPVTVELP